VKRLRICTLQFLAILFAIVVPSTAPVWAQDKIRITSSNDSLLYAPIYAAAAMGYFKQNGIEIERTLSTTGPTGLAALMAGNLEMVMGVPSTPLLARKAGGDIKMIAGIASQYGVNVAVTKKWAEAHHLSAKSSYKERLAALKGITMGVTGPGGGNDQLVSYLAEQAGLNRARDMNVVALGDASAMLAAFSQGRVDAISISTPTSNIAAHDFDGLLIFNTGVGDVEPLNGFFGAAVSARGDWLAKNEAVAARFVKSVQMGLDAIHDPDQTNQVRDAVHKLVFQKIDARVFADIWKDNTVGTPKTTVITRKMVQDLIDYGNRFSQNKLDGSIIDESFTNAYGKKQ
jgi:NitT/TauT family transport system substrate-binding protein